MSKDAGLVRLFFKNVFFCLLISSPLLNYSNYANLQSVYFELMVRSSQYCGLTFFDDQKIKRLNVLKIVAWFTLFNCN